jgi:hypothetical protein
MTAKVKITNEGPDALLYSGNRVLMPGRSISHEITEGGNMGGLNVNLQLLHIDGDATPPEEPAPAAPTPSSLGMMQNDESRKLIGPEFWFYSTLQAESAPTNDAKVRIMLNCGCDAHGVWHDAQGEPVPAANRGFEQADTLAERERLKRYNSTPMVYDIAIIQGQPRLALDRHVAAVTGLTPTGKYPNFYAIRAVDAAALSECLQSIAASRGNPGA